MNRLPLVFLGVLGALAVPSFAADFTSDWHHQPDRIWIGPACWANPMEDWRITDGRLECTSPAPNRSLHLLTHQLGDGDGTLEMSVVVGLQPSSDGEGGEGKTPTGSVGFEIGIRSELGDYRSSLIRGSGLRVVLTSDADVKVGNAAHFPGTIQFGDADDLVRRLNSTGLRLKWFRQSSGGRDVLIFRIHDPQSDELLTVAGQMEIPPDQLVGNIALVHNPAWRTQGPQGSPGARQRQAKQTARFWFRDFRVSGTKVVENQEHAFGPILYAMHTLSRGVMTMTAQMPPVGANDDQTVRLQVPLAAAKTILRVPGVEGSARSADAGSRRSTLDAQSSDLKI